MSYTAWEIIWFLLLALILGFILGWIIFGRFFKGDQVQSASGNQDAMAQDLADAKARNAKLEGDLAACKDARARLEADASAAASPSTTPLTPTPTTATAPIVAAPAAASASAKKETFTTDAPKPEAFSGDAMAAAKANPDDLKKIWGVGPVMERVLNDHGCYTFQQVASLSARDVEWLAANLNTFPDRITRDKWVEQAAKLAAQS